MPNAASPGQPPRRRTSLRRVMRVDRMLDRPRRAALFAVALAVAGCGSQPAPIDAAAPAASCVGGEAPGAGERAAAVREVVDTAMREHDLRAVIVRVTDGGDDVVTLAAGEAMPGVVATPDHHFHNGAAAISYLATLLLRLTEQGVVGLDDPIDTWHPDLPNADRVTLRMLATSTSGYRDYVPNEEFLAALYAQPFERVSEEALIAYGLADPPWYEPGTNWSYAHTNFVLLGQALSEAAGRPLDALLRDEVLEPLGLDDTRSWDTAQIPEPALHHFTDERGVLEDATYWTPSWQLPAGAIMTTNVCDLAAAARGVGRGELVSDASYAELIAPHVVGRSGPDATCPAGVCIEHTDARYFALGVVVAGGWILQTPTFLGFSGVQAYLPEEDVAIAVAVSGPAGPNHATRIFVELARALTPDHVPPL